MFLSLGPNQCIPKKEIIGIFSTSSLESVATDEFIRMAKEEGFVIGTASKKMKSFIVADENVYFSNLTPQTLCKRSLNRERLSSDK